MLDINKAHYSTRVIWYKNWYYGDFGHFLDLPTEHSQILAEQQQGGGLEPPERPLGTLYPPKKIILTKIMYGLPLLLQIFTTFRPYVAEADDKRAL